MLGHTEIDSNFSNMGDKAYTKHVVDANPLVNDIYRKLSEGTASRVSSGMGDLNLPLHVQRRECGQRG